MRSTLHIKGKHLWKLSALVVLSAVVASCVYTFNSIDQPLTATVGSVVPITIDAQVKETNYAPAKSLNYFMAMLAPKGWDITHNATITYTSAKGDGTMVPIDPKAIEPSQSSANLTWAQSLFKKFGIGNNLVDDVEWVTFVSKELISVGNGDLITGKINIKLTVGADGNDTYYRPTYVIGGTADGLTETGYYGVQNAPCIEVTGGSTGDLNDYCDPQLTNVSPARSIQNDFVTVTFNNKLTTTDLSGETELYIYVKKLYYADGSTTTPSKDLSEKSLLTQTSAGSGQFQVTFWPETYFGLKAGQTLSKMEYSIVDKSGHEVGLNSTTPFFSYKYKCN